jgi:S-adenosylmethionine hydrolase
VTEIRNPKAEGRKKSEIRNPNQSKYNSSVRCITLTTDFGSRDWFVGTMKGVILGLAPRATIIDLTHEVTPGDIRAGAFALAASYAFFPRHTIHVAVVDPGVGTKRRAIAVETSNYIFVGPDNGLLSWALEKEKIRAIYSLENPAYQLPQVSATFHGRDVFAPVAAHLSRHLPARKLGRILPDFVRLRWPEPEQTRHRIQGEVLYIDRFGNAVTNISDRTLSAISGKPAIFIGRKCACAIFPSYQSVAPGRPLAVVGSSGFLEIAVNGGSAAKHFQLRIGARVDVRKPRAKPLIFTNAR